jgi:hypothetical protein
LQIYLHIPIFCCIFAADLRERVKSMEATMRTLQITLPLADAAFLRRLSGNMGWQIAPKRVTKRRRSIPVDYYQSEQFYRDLEAAEQDIANGKGLRVSSKQELDALFA